ncbi:coiled-coil domain-containing protein 39 [Scleropages formosus]|uniref:coiled-coil domain-containing protein 39 n=1 Tax=Scleropages formosus TaxID=113540 RepID=UPI000630D2FA|nr:coiled-coil domain-containing protein 39 [Scleropages formosus]
MAKAVLSEVGWGEGFAMPVANAENKALEDELQRKQKEKSNVENKIYTYRDRIQAMGEHLKNVRQELSHTQGLLRAREKEIESEVHFRALADREMGRLRQEITKLDRELGSLRDKKNSHENNIFKASQKLEELMCQLNWDQKALDAWLEKSARKDEDTMAIIKYAKQDEGKIRELTLSIEKMTIEAQQKRRTLDNELTETITAQIALDKTAENFRQAHVERQELIQQWESTIEQMRKRDREMEQCSLMLAEVNQKVREREGLIKEKKKFLEGEVENNREYERKIAAAERLAARLRQELQEQEANRSRLQDELGSLKCAVARAAADVEGKRSQLAALKKHIVEKTSKLKAAKERNAALQGKLESATESTVGVEEQAAQMEQMLKESEQALKEVNAQLQRHREALFRKTQELQVLKAKEKETAAQISGTRATLVHLDKRLSKLDQDSLKQQEIIYSQDFQIHLLERKMARLQGEMSTEEKQNLDKKVSELNDILEERKKTATMLALQLKKLQDDIRCVTKEMEKKGAMRSELSTKIEELNLIHDTSEKELKRLRLSKQDAMVEDNILKLEVKRLRELLYCKADDVLSLEKRALRLRAAMAEREEEIKLHREMLLKHVKVADQERQGLSTEVQERLSRVDKMRNRYEVMTMSMAFPEGEEDRLHAYYVIKVAQEKEELQRKGDDLDAKICKMEKEIHALENTLHVVNSHNSTYRRSFQKVAESSKEFQEKLKLEEQKKAVEEKCKHKRRCIRELQEDLQNRNGALDTVVREEVSLKEKMDEIQSQITALNKDLSSQKEKLDRVNKECSKLSKGIRSSSNTKGETPEERDIVLRELKDFNRTVNNMLLEAIADHPDLKSAVEMYLLQAGLTLPSPASTPSSRQSSKPPSARSSASSLRSVDSAASSGSRTALSCSVRMLDLSLPVASSPVATPSPRNSYPASASSQKRKSP